MSIDHSIKSLAEYSLNDFLQNTLPRFSHLSLSGEDASTFLQGQLTCDVHKLIEEQRYQATAIANLKGRVAFGVWIKLLETNHYELVVSEDCSDALLAHLKKYSAFSKVTISTVEPIYPYIDVVHENAASAHIDSDGVVVDDIKSGHIASGNIKNKTTFSKDSAINTTEQAIRWALTSIATGNYWITQSTQETFQPQELRLHQRGGVDYDKGCYLGQEVIARLYFKASPKAYLHRVGGVMEMDVDVGDVNTSEDLEHSLTDSSITPLTANSFKLPEIRDKSGKPIAIVNMVLNDKASGNFAKSMQENMTESRADSTETHAESHAASHATTSKNKRIYFEALVVARPEQLANSELTILPLPTALQADVARQPSQPRPQ